ncbi:MAG: anthranilate synthase component I [Phycisphaerales bacterium]|nr:anthranilate synthase component I [Phycisphaerales bacterium]
MPLPRIPPVACVYRRIAARVAPAALFERLYGDETFSFLYESLEAHGGRGRYSFIGAKPRAVLRCTGTELALEIDGRVYRDNGPPIEALRTLLKSQSDVPPVAPFCGGAVGYLGYDTIRWVERIPSKNVDDIGAADALFLFPREVICFDHLEKVAHVLLYQEIGKDERIAELRAAIDACELETPARDARDGAAASRAGDAGDDPLAAGLRSNMTRDEFCAMVRRAKEYILAGDIFQVVLSQRFEFDLAATPLDLYKSLRLTNPSPYMYYLKLDDLHIAGSSPEILVRLYGRRVVTKPLAGTRRRGATPEEDAALERELRADPKERAEHVMLVDLGRNDLGRVCEFGSVEATGVLDIERHSRVMHLVSTVEGWLRPECDALDVFSATFPAGTVSGAPKVRAMEIIDELEPTRRGIYAGAIGYFSLMGDVDLCIAIRTIVMRGGKGYIQAGAGIVADSVPEFEYEETLNKARALMRAVELAKRNNVTR